MKKSKSLYKKKVLKNHNNTKNGFLRKKLMLSVEFKRLTSNGFEKSEVILLRSSPKENLPNRKKSSPLQISNVYFSLYINPILTTVGISFDNSLSIILPL